MPEVDQVQETPKSKDPTEECYPQIENRILAKVITATASLVGDILDVTVARRQSDTLKNVYVT